ncbi:helix-turn-helix transcriptional regulator [Ligilactobacillus faecis]|uniref:helix-turn-helix transcriptional regulator n=1 Tax=Ligilactobacillus faecis TaxID=762833 RepID=UPI002469691B|nr:WYL domain-containing protein [Ligilactobacillus faecis]WGN89922.1 WYL domain-containing protein [Ligilactobacillus faecis]
MSGSATRQLTIYQTLLTGAPVTKKDLVERFDVDERSIQRDISNIRNFIAEENLELELEYRRSTKAYQLVGKTQTFGKAHVLALVKILLASRAFNKDETEQLIELLLARLEPGEQRELNWIIKNEQSNYLPLTSATELLKPLWDFSLYIVRSQAVDITYTKQRGEKVTRTIVPKAIIFSDYYFYVVSYNPKYDNDLFYRLDRIKEWYPSDEKIKIEHKDRYEDGKLRKKIQYMTPGDQKKIRFEFTGILEAALDRFPMSKVIENDGKKALLEVETIDQGAKMWLLSQGQRVKIVSPADFKNEMQAEIKAMLDNYVE